MKTIDYTTIDKSDWGDGPWQGAVDKRQWFDTVSQLPCLIKRSDAMGNWCGYVGVARTHPLFGLNYSDAEQRINFPRGLSFSGSCDSGPADSSICHKVEPGESDDVWWLGFDFGRYCDYMPVMAAYIASRGRPVFAGPKSYTTQADAEAATVRLAAKLADMTKAADMNKAIDARALAALMGGTLATTTSTVRSGSPPSGPISVDDILSQIEAFEPPPDPFNGAKSLILAPDVFTRMTDLLEPWARNPMFGTCPEIEIRPTLEIGLYVGVPAGILVGAVVYHSSA